MISFGVNYYDEEMKSLVGAGMVFPICLLFERIVSC